MTDQFEHNPGDHEDPVAAPTWLIVVVGSVLLAVCVLAVAASYYHARDAENERKVLAPPTIAVEEMRREHEARLTGGSTEAFGELPPIRMERRRPDEDSLVIPIERAMELMAMEAAAARGDAP